MYKMRFIIIFSLVILVTLQSYATHVGGGSITYKALGNNEYVVTLTYIRD